MAADRQQVTALSMWKLKYIHNRNQNNETATDDSSSYTYYQVTIENIARTASTTRLVEKKAKVSKELRDNNASQAT